MSDLNNADCDRCRRTVLSDGLVEVREHVVERGIIVPRHGSTHIALLCSTCRSALDEWLRGCRA